MYGKEHVSGNNEVYSRTLRAGSRTYFFDVKKTRLGEHYLTITESKKYPPEKGVATYKKYKLHLYKEDFFKFQEALGETIHFITEQDETSSPSISQKSANKYTQPDLDYSSNEDI